METANTLAIVSNDPHVRSESIVPIASGTQCVLSLRPNCVTKNSVSETILALETIIWKPGLSRYTTGHLARQQTDRPIKS